MKTIIAGSRGIEDGMLIAKAIYSAPWTITEVVSGGARGVDRWGEHWARLHGIPIKRFLPDWSRGRGAGHERNGDMAEYADALIAIWDLQSPGTKGMIEKARKRGLLLHLYPVKP